MFSETVIFRTLVTFSPIAASARIAKLYLFFSDCKDRRDQMKTSLLF